MTERSFYRFGGAAGIVGAILAGVGNAIHPRLSDFGDPVRAELEMVAGSSAWIPIHLVIAAGVLLITVGLYALARSLSEELDGGYRVGRLALGSLLVSAPLALATLAIDGYATKEVADAWAASGGSESAFAAGQAVGAVGWSIFMFFAMLFIGITPLLFGIAIAQDRKYPAAMGWPVVVLGAGSVVAGLIGILGGPSQAFFLTFLVTSGLLTFWVLGISIVVWRRASAEARA